MTTAMVLGLWRCPHNVSTNPSSLLYASSSNRFCHAVSHRGVLPEIASTPQVGLMGTKKSNKVDSRAFGIHHNAIPPAALTVLRILRNEGFDAYLVGGCVRDLILKRTPKDFDVITTANLKQIRSRFHKAHIVGQRFPICMVHVRGSIIEVSSFETVAKHAEKKTEPHSSQAPRGFGKKDLTLWRNSLKRDYTINRTVVARILRGLRLAARLGFSFSSDTATAIRSFSSSLLTLSKSRIMMEFNYMLSYGAAEPSLCLLQRFNLLRFFLPFHAAYLEQQASTKSDQNSTMLMAVMISSVNLVVEFMVGLLAFHLTLINNPQDALVVLTFASILYHGEWKEGIRFAKENSEVQAKFVPELSSSFASKFDEELVMKVSQLAILVQDSLDILTESENYLESVTRHPTSPCSGLVFIPKRTSKDVAEIFQLLVKKKGCQSHEQRRKCFDIDYALLGQGYLWETRFVVGKVILETMGCWQRRGDNVSEENNCMHTEITGDTRLSDVIKEQLQVKKGQKHSISLCSPEIEHQPAKKRNFVPSEVGINSEHFSTRLTEEVVEIGICQERANKHTKFYEVDELPREELISVLGNMSDNRCEQPNENATEKNKSEANKKKKKKKQTHKSEKHSTVMEKKHHVTQEDEAAEQQGAVQENISDERCQKPDEKANEKKKGELKTKKHTHKSERPSTVKEKKLHVTQEDEAAEQQGAMQGNISDERCQKPDEKAIEKKKGELKTKKHTHKSERPSTQEDEVAKQQGVVKTKETEHKQVNKETGNRRLLSDIFK
ncbi:hypothetical protein G4B88_006951 [Cannabis sativa]|uniref:Uncharacterized protein n=1 Tax=Cannabis sativa TaxID=3483 RepID=A0A7J6G3W0_CANSA|nr:hypothetical protein G4B88_006951 [Cannabis sativa]